MDRKPGSTTWASSWGDGDRFRIIRVRSRATLDRYIGKFDLVIMTGGLGLTRDDLTKQTLANYFESPMVTVPEVLDKITAYFKEGAGI